MKAILFFSVCMIIPFISLTQIVQSDTVICKGDSIILDAQMNFPFQIFNQTQSVNSNWTIGPSVTANKPYLVKVSGLYSMWSNCLNSLDAAFMYNTGCGLTNCAPYNGTINSNWIIQGFAGIRPDNDVCGGINNEYVYSLTPTTSTLLFSFNDNAPGDNSGSLTFQIEQVEPDSLVWSTGQNTPSILISPGISTTYYCTFYYGNQSVTDSVLVTVNEGFTFVQNETGFDSYTWAINGQTYTESGQYSYSIDSNTGCDSVYTLNLTLSYTGIDELSNQQDIRIVKIFDVNGLETEHKPNTILLLLFSDGHVERRYLME